jgi:cytidine deaminase
MSQSFSFSYEAFAAPAALSTADRALLEAATEAISLAYAPYSGFHVGAALLLADGSIVKAANQENASYPAGICAERAALAAASSSHPGMVITAVALTYNNTRQAKGSNGPVLSPCGICRQSLLEKVKQQGADFRLILGSPAGEGVIISKVVDLLPFAFSGDHLQ